MLPERVDRARLIHADIERERVALDQRESMRILSWENDMAAPLLHIGRETRSFDGGMGHRWHYHPEIELTYVAEGRGIRWIGTKRQSFEAPEVILLGSSLPHTWEMEGRSSGYAIQFRLGMSQSPLSALPEIAGLGSLFDLASCGLKLSEGEMHRITELMQKITEATPIERLSTFFQILSALDQLDPGEAETLSAPVNATEVPRRHAEAIARAIHFLTDHYQDAITLGDVLDCCDMTRATFSRHFPTLTGQSYTDFLQTLRLEHCHRLLLAGKHNITEAAFEAGFQSLSHFNKVFKKRWGRTPRESLRGVKG